MKILVVYDTVFGNTGQVARAIGDALGSTAEVGVVQANAMQPDQLQGVELLIVGSPTRGFRPTEATTAFLSHIPGQALAGVRVAAFDTRVALEDIQSPVFRFVVRTGGFAARLIAKQLTRRGGALALPPEGFLVDGQEGPLKQGELERAAEWAKRALAA